MRTLFRAGLFFATFVMVVAAIGQLSGRIAFAFLDRAEPHINEFLADRSIVVSGLEGTWRYLNPGLRVARVSLPAGNIDDVLLELDVLESIMRGDWVLTRAHVGAAELEVERVEGRWQLRGMPAQGPAPDLKTLLWQTDQFLVDGRVRINGPGGGAVLDVRYRSANRGGMHGGEVRVRNAACGDCSIQLAYDVRDEVLWVRPASRRVIATSEGMELPLAPVVGQGATARLANLNLSWRDSAMVGGGRLEIALSEMKVAGSEPLSFDGALEVVANGGGYRAKSTRLDLTLGEQVQSLGELLATADDQQAELFVPLLDITSLAPMFATSMADVERAGEWLNAMALQGRLENIRFGLRRSTDAEKDTWQGAYGASVRDLQMSGFRGAPTVRGGSAELFGTGGHIAVDVDSPDIWMHFNDVFKQGWPLTATTGRLEAWLEPGYFALAGHNIRTKLGDMQVHGSFALAQPVPRPDKRLSLLIFADKAGVATGQGLVPYKLDPGLVDWLQSAPKEGRFEQIEFAYQGQIHAKRGEPVRRLALKADVFDSSVVFHPDWPMVEQVNGRFYLSGRQTSVRADQGRSLGVDIGGSTVHLVGNGAWAELDVATRSDGEALLSFVRQSPLQQNMPFVTDQWQASGPVALEGRVRVPLKKAEGQLPEVALTSTLGGLALTIPEFRSEFSELKGVATFSLPHGLRSSGIDGRLWEHPMKLTIDHDDEFVRFSVNGHMTDARTFAMVGMSDPGLLKGSYDYKAELAVAASNDNVTSLHLETDLLGVEVLAPKGVGKPPERGVDTVVAVRFLPGYIHTDFSYGEMVGWVQIDEAPRRGAVGLSASPPLLAESEDVLLVSGHLPEIYLDEWTGAGGGALELPFPWRVENLTTDYFIVGDMEFKDLTLQANKEPNGLMFAVDGPDLKGNVGIPTTGPMALNFSLVRLKPGLAEPDDFDEPSKDPMPIEALADLPEAKVLIERIVVDEEEFGRWQFDLRRPDENAAIFENLTAVVKGVSIQSPKGVRWEDGRSQFEGVLDMVDLAEVLPQWDYAPTLSSSKAALHANVEWPGSPLNVGLLGLDGDVYFEADEGRFADVEAGGGARFLSLFNFSTVFRRLNLNFSDVVGKGLSFEEIEAQVRLSQGRLTFIEPMQVNSTASDFRIGGSVDLNSGVLDNEMVVTLPVSSGLPWYGVYVALANPLAGLGVLVGERVLRKPLQQFTSAKYAVRGTLDEPDVRFVEFFNSRMSKPELEVPAVSEQDQG